MLVPAAATTFVTEAMKTTLADAFSVVASDVSSIVTTALPYAIGIAGLYMALRIGVKFFKGLAN